MDQMIKNILDTVPYFKKLQEQSQNQGLYEPGHYYSPIPNKNEVLTYINVRKPREMELSGIDLNKDHQFELLKEYSEYYKELPFHDEQEPGCRYFYKNDWFSYPDAIFLYSFLRKYKPKRIIEIGSGFSSAIILDTVDRFFSHRPEITFVEPNPERLESILQSTDKNYVRILDKKLQDISPDFFQQLESGDLLFIDSTHVVKCGSDVQLLLFDILPLLQPGVFVHFHDIFYPFEYPDQWLKNGVFWNENYFLRAFLSYNCEWSIHFFCDYATCAFSDFINDNMPLCLKIPGGSLYIQRRVKS